MPATPDPTPRPTPEALAHLAEQLASTPDGEMTLNPTDHSVIRGALASLAAAQLTIERQALLLRSFNQDAEAIEREAMQAIRAADAVPQARSSGAEARFEAQAAADARRELVRSLSGAPATAEVIGAVLAYVVGLLA